MQGKVIIRCPAMPVLATWNPFVRECQELYCPDCQIILDNGQIFPFTITFPKALVHFQSLGNWLVDEVPAYGQVAGYGKINVTMEKEKVVRTSWKTMEALPCSAIGTVNLFGKECSIGPKISPTGELTFFPKCKTTAVGFGLFKYIAEPIIAEGVVTVSFFK